MSIPQEIIEEIKQRISFFEICSEYLELKQSGKNFSGLCPFHQEKTPSFIVFPRNQNYHCFGCGAHGDAIRFLQEYEKLSYVEAIEKLAETDEQQARLIELRFFAGLAVKETAEAMGVSVSTTERNWRVAKAWLRRELAT